MEVNKSFKLLNIHCFKTKLGSRILLKKNTELLIIGLCQKQSKRQMRQDRIWKASIPKATYYIIHLHTVYSIFRQIGTNSE